MKSMHVAPSRRQVTCLSSVRLSSLEAQIVKLVPSDEREAVRGWILSCHGEGRFEVHDLATEAPMTPEELAEDIRRAALSARVFASAPGFMVPVIYSRTTGKPERCCRRGCRKRATGLNVDDMATCSVPRSPCDVLLLRTA